MPRAAPAEPSRACASRSRRPRSAASAGRWNIAASPARSWRGARPRRRISESPAGRGPVLRTYPC